MRVKLADERKIWNENRQRKYTMKICDGRIILFRTDTSQQGSEVLGEIKVILKITLLRSFPRFFSNIDFVSIFGYVIY